MAWLLLLPAIGSIDDWYLPGVVTAAGALLLMGSLAWLCWRGIQARQHLAPERYRGPSVILLFVLAVVAASLLSLPSSVAAAFAGRDPMDPGTLGTILLLLATPAVFAVVGLVYVVRPRALEGARFDDGTRTAINIGRGIALGTVAWVIATAVAACLVWVVTQVTGNAPEDSQIVAVLARTLPPLAAIVLIGILAPAAEEFFFRWIAVNAWEREHGARTAVVGSAALFGGAHLLGGSVLALPSIFMLGLFLAALYVTTRSLPLIIATHVTFNSLSLAVLFAVGV